MKAHVLTGIKKIEIIEKEDPVIRSDREVLLKIKMVGVCGSDIHYYKKGKIGDQVVKYPFTLGHECVGEVLDLGNNVTKVKIGQTVAVDPCISCGYCCQCVSGREHTCLNQRFLGSPGQLEGCLSEYIVMPERNCYALSREMTTMQGVLVEPLSIGFYAVNFLWGRRIDSVAILGVGPIGLSVLLTAKQRDLRKIFITDKLDYRVEIAKNAGAFWGENPDKSDVVSLIQKMEPDLLDAVFECCGKQEAIDQAVDILKPGGSLILVGIPEVDNIYFNISKIRRKELIIQNVRRQNKCTGPVINLIQSKKINPDFMITHHLPFEEAGEAFDLVSDYSDGVVKALVHI